MCWIIFQFLFQHFFKKIGKTVKIYWYCTTIPLPMQPISLIESTQIPQGFFVVLSACVGFIPFVFDFLQNANANFFQQPQQSGFVPLFSLPKAKRVLLISNNLFLHFRKNRLIRRRLFQNAAGSDGLAALTICSGLPPGARSPRCPPPPWAPAFWPHGNRRSCSCRCSRCPSGRRAFRRCPHCGRRDGRRC